jgi:hypothetical protein
MRPPDLILFDQTKFPLTLANGLRRTFADVVSAPLPQHLAELMCQLHEDRDKRSGGEPGHGASAAETSCRIDRRGRR